jgi:nucleoside-diphosphate-sugar epimerase
MRVLVTGGSGLVGRHVVHHLVGADVETITLSRVRAGEVADPRLATAHRAVAGDVGDPSLLRRELEGVDVVVHLAAIPAPYGVGAAELLAANSVTTMAVFEASADAGVSGVVYASSTSILGPVFGEGRSEEPAYLPIDEAHPIHPADPYALGKSIDEATARMAARRWGLASLGLRLPYTDTAEGLARRAIDAGQYSSFDRELWGYLDVRDAAAAIERAVHRLVDGRLAGAEVTYLVADDVIRRDLGLDDLVGAAYPRLQADVVDRRGAFDCSRAERLLDFRPHHLIPRGDDIAPGPERGRP